MAQDDLHEDIELDFCWGCGRYIPAGSESHLCSQCLQEEEDEEEPNTRRLND